MSNDTNTKTTDDTKAPATTFTVTGIARSLHKIDLDNGGELLELRLGRGEDLPPVPVKVMGRTAWLLTNEVEEGQRLTVRGRATSIETRNGHNLLSLTMGGRDEGEPCEVVGDDVPLGSEATVRGIVESRRLVEWGSRWFYVVEILVKDGSREHHVPVRVWNTNGEAFIGEVPDGTPVEVRGTVGADTPQDEPEKLFAHVDVDERGWRILDPEELAEDDEEEVEAPAETEAGEPPASEEPEAEEEATTPIDF